MQVVERLGDKMNVEGISRKITWEVIWEEKIMFRTLKSLNSSVGDERNGTVKSFPGLFYFDPQNLWDGLEPCFSIDQT